MKRIQVGIEEMVFKITKKEYNYEKEIMVVSDNLKHLKRLGYRFEISVKDWDWS